MKIHASLRIVAALLVCGTLAVASTARAAIISSYTQVSTDPSVPGDVSNSDLINSGSAALSGVTSSGYSAQVSTNSSPNAVLNDGLHGFRASNNPAPLAASSNGPWTLTYALTGAFDIDSIVTHSAADDNRYDQNYELFFEFDGNPGVFASQGVFNNSGFQTGGHWRVEISDDNSAPIGTNVTGIRFEFANGVVAPTVYSEVDVFEAGAVPEPSSFVLAGLGLLGLAGFGLRRRSK